MSKSTVLLDKNEERNDEELPNKKQESKFKEKSDADLDREEIDRIRKKFNEKKLSRQENKKASLLDVDDDNDQQDISMSKS